MSDLLFVRPADDSAAIHVAGWGQAVLLTVGRHHTSADLANGAATPTSVDQQLGPTVDHLFFFGHGNASALLAQGQILVDETNVGQVSGIVVAIACESALELGPDAVKHHGVGAYLGFDDELGFPAIAQHIVGFFVSRALGSLFSANRDVGYAADRLEEGFDHLRHEFKRNGASYGLTSRSDVRTAWLFQKSNRNSLQVYGQSTATI